LPKRAFSHFPTQGDGLEYGPKKTKRFLHHSPKKTKTKNLIRLDVGVCYSIITGMCKVPYVSFLPDEVHLIMHGNNNMVTVYVVQIEPKNGFETEKVKEGYQQCGYLPQAGPAPNVSGRNVIYLAFWENMLQNSLPHRGGRECGKEFCSLCSIVHLHGLLLILVGLLKQLVIGLFSSQHSVMTWSNSPSLSSDSICVRS